MRRQLDCHHSLLLVFIISFALVSRLTRLKCEQRITDSKINYFHFYILQPVERRSTGGSSRLVFRNQIKNLAILSSVHFLGNQRVVYFTFILQCKSLNWKRKYNIINFVNCFCQIGLPKRSTILPKNLVMSLFTWSDWQKNAMLIFLRKWSQK